MQDDRRPLALITGASRGLGAATALALARAGYDLILTARNLQGGTVPAPMTGASAQTHRPQTLPSDLPSVVAQAQALGARCTARALDLLNPASIDAAVEAVQGGGHQLDLLIHNAVYQGADSQWPVQALTDEAMLNSLRGNVLGPLRLTRGLLPGLLAQRGLVVCVVSGAGQYDPPMSAAHGGWAYAYGASKAALARLPGLLRAEHGSQGLRAVSVNPGVVLTEVALATLGSASALEQRQGAWTPQQAAQAMCAVIRHPDEAVRQSRHGVLDLQRAPLTALQPSSE